MTDNDNQRPSVRASDGRADILIIRYGSGAQAHAVEIRIADNDHQYGGEAAKGPGDIRVMTRALCAAIQAERRGLGTILVYVTTDGRTIAVPPSHVISIEEPES